jgi:hypothetical protein
MIKKLNYFLKSGTTNFFRNTVGEIKAINTKYKKPHTKMTKGIRFSLIMLRGYLIVLVLILFYKFITLLK